MEFNSKVSFRRCCNNEQDMLTIYNWSNDKEVRANSFSSNEIKLEDHKKWFNSKMNDEDYRILFFMVDGKEIGMVRLEICDREATISYLISKDYRGMGFGKMMLSHLETYILKNEMISRLYAEVKYSNISSQKIFEGLNYIKLVEEDLIKYTKQI